MKRRYEDLTGKKFNRVTVVSFSDIVRGKTIWTCRCDCGKRFVCRADAIKTGATKSCGCLKVEQNAEFEDLTGRTFNYLKVLKLSKRRGNQGQILWVCDCLKCDRTVVTSGSSLRSGHAKTCGCLQREKAVDQAYQMGKSNKTHGATGSTEYIAWRGLKSRCLNPNAPEYADYGGRGIKIFEGWIEDFDAFLRYIGKRPTKRHQVDRINVNGNYEPGNVRWVLPKQQQRNRRDNIPVEYKGQTKCISEWAEEYGIKMPVLWCRIRKLKWPIHEALTLPVAKTIRDKWKYRELRGKGK